MKSRLHTPLLGLLVAALCYLAAQLGGMMIITEPQTLWPLWPGCAVLAAILLVSPRKDWPILIPAGLAGFVIYDWRAGVAPDSIYWLIFADIGEIAVTAVAVSYSFGGMPRLDSLKAFTKYAFFTMILGPLVASTIGIQALNGDKWVSWQINFLSEGLAFLTLTPAILGWFAQTRSWLRPTLAHYLEFTTLITTLSFLSFGIFVAGTHAPPALLYSLVPFFLWAALRFGSTGVATCASIVALVSIWGALHGRGPFPETDPVGRVFSLQLFLLFTTIPFMLLAVLVEERKRQSAVLRESEERFRLMADTAPSLIWMSGTDKLCTFFNRGWLRFTGRAMQQELGEGWAQGVHPDDLPACLHTYSASFDSRTDFETEYRLRRFDGQYRWLVDYGTPRFTSSGAFCGYIGSCIDITERKISEMSLRELTGRLIHAQEEERARIARELHDDISQRMAFLQIGLEQFEQGNPDLTLTERKEIINMTQVASEVSSDLHTISHQLHPARLDLQGLVAALTSFCREVSAQHELRIDFQHRDVPSPLPNDVALCLFRIVQEALRNVVKHAATSAAAVELSGRDDGVELSICDSGVGFNPDSAEKKGGLGLISMRERLRLIGGNLTIDSAPARGTRILVRVPFSSVFTTELKRFRANA